MQIMRNKEKKLENQKRLFKTIQKDFPPQSSLAEKISELLGIGIDSAYRRIRGDKTISYDETVIICKHFGISLDVQLYGINKMQYNFVPSDLMEIKSYLSYAQELALITEKISMKSGGEIILSAADVPAYQYVAFSELALFQLFSWHKNVYDFSGTYEDFINSDEINSNAISQVFSNIYQNYQQVPSTEIWTNHTIDSLLKLVKYHFELDHFHDKQIPVLLCDHLLNMLTNLKEWAVKGYKAPYNTPFKFFVNEIDIGNTFIFSHNEDMKRCIIRLFTINGLHIKDERFCHEVEIWLDSLMKRSVLISGTSTKERFNFFSSQIKKVTSLIDFINAH